MSFTLGSNSVFTRTALSGPHRPSSNFSATDWTLQLFGEPANSSERISLAEYIANLPGPRRSALQDRIDPASLAELDSISRESDPELYFEALLNLGRRCEVQQRLDLALAIYGLLREGTGFPSIESRATTCLQAIQGVGAAGPRAEFLLRTLAQQASDPTAIFAMGAAGAVFRMTRLATLSRLAATPNPGFLTQLMGAGRMASLAGFLFEAPTFTLAGRLGNAALGRSQDWGSTALSRDLASSFLVLGGLRLAGWGANAAYRGISSPLSATSVRPLQTLFQQGGMFTGILLGHTLEERFGLRPHHDGATTLVDSLATLLQFNIAGRLAHHAFGPRFSAWERGLDLQSEALGHGRISGPFPPAGLASEPALANGLRLFSADRVPANPLRRPDVLFMEGLGDKSEVQNGRPNDGTTHTPRVDIEEGDSGETISWLPKGAQQLEMALREFLNMHPHAAAVFELNIPENGGNTTSEVRMINQRLTEMFGYTEAEAVGLSLDAFLHRRDIPFFRELSKSLTQNGTLNLPETRYRRKDGSLVWCNTTGMVRQVNGRRLGFAFLEDITARRQQQAALEASEVRNRALVNALPDLLFRIRADMTFLDVRQPQAGLFVLPAEQLIGTRVHDLPLPEELKQFGIETMARALETGTFQRVEYELPMPDGSRRYQEARVSPSGTDEVVVIVRDITDLKRAEVHRIAAERLDAVQMLSRGLAHNIANRLAVMMPFQRFNQETLRELVELFQLVADAPANGTEPLLSEPFLKRLGEIHADTFRWSQKGPELQLNSPQAVYQALAEILTKTLEDHRVGQENTELILSAINSFRRLSTEPEKGPPFNLHSLLDPNELGGMLGPGIRLQLNLAPGKATVPGPRSHVADIVQNLVVNARDAMEDSPLRELQIETRALEISSEDMAQLQIFSPNPLPTTGGRFLRLSVRDTGSGMEDSVRTRIFEAYFSTKSTAKVGAGNRGLGLAMTYKFVRDAGGFITVESRLGEGTTFHIYWPSVEAPTVEAAPEDQRAALERKLAAYFKR